jgi:glycosyltransferase involved in cell wall biosynthesis
MIIFMPESVSQQHILFSVNAYPPSVGGVQQHVMGLATELAQQGCRVTVVCLGHEQSDRYESGVRVIRRRRSWGFGTVMAFPGRGILNELLKLLDADIPTCISTHTRFFPMTWVGDRLARAWSVPRIHTEHGSDFVAGVSPFVALASRITDLTLGARTLRRANLVLGVSPEVVAFVYRLSGVVAKIFFNAIEPPPSLEGIAEPVEKTDETSSLPPGRKSSNSSRNLVFLGRLVPGKGWRVAIEVTQQLHDQGIHTHLDLLGDGPDREKVEAAIADSGISANLHGFVTHDVMWQVLARGVLLNPSTLSEGFQTSLLEALAVGAPIVSSPVPGVTFLAADGAPITVVPRIDVGEWTKAVAATLATPPKPYAKTKISSWLWPARASQYALLADEVTTEAAPLSRPSTGRVS